MNVIGEKGPIEITGFSTVNVDEYKLQIFLPWWLIFQNYQVEASWWRGWFSNKKVEPAAASIGRDLSDTVTGKEGAMENAVQAQEQKLDNSEPSKVDKFMSRVKNAPSTVFREVKKGASTFGRFFKNLIRTVIKKVKETEVEVEKYFEAIKQKVSKKSCDAFTVLVISVHYLHLIQLFINETTSIVAPKKFEALSVAY